MRGQIKLLNSRGDRAYFLEGEQVSQEAFDAAFPAKEIGPSSVPSLTGWPLKSDALGVHPRKVGEAHADARAKGVPTDFTPGGRPIFRDRNHRRQYLRAYGYYDRNAGYSDPSPGDFSGERPDPPDLKKEYEDLGG